MRPSRAASLTLACALSLAAPLAAQEVYPGKTLVTATSWEAEAFSPDGIGALGSLSVEGLFFGNLGATLQAGYRGSLDGQSIRPFPGASLFVGWRLPVLDLASVTPFAGPTFDILSVSYPPTPVVNLTVGARLSARLRGRDYLTLTPSVSIPAVGDGSVRFALAFGTRRESVWFLPVPPVNPRVGATPVLFSPDDDGHDDVVTISIKAERPESVRNWKLTAVLKDGTAWKEFSGTGSMPETIVWDGRSSTDVACDAGDEFDLRLETVDILGEASSSVTAVKVTVDILVLKDGDRYKVRVPDINFPANSFRLGGDEAEADESSRMLLEDNYSVLVRLASLFARFPEYSLVIEGHANSVYWQTKESFDAEQANELIPLSRKRAETVAEALVLLGIDERRIRTAGYGATRPLVDFSDTSAIWKNRRVEFILER